MKKAQREVFLAELAKHGIVQHAARTANPNAKTARGAGREFYRLRETDAEFAEAWEQAIEEAGATIEAEIYRRGKEGFEETRTDPAGRVTVLRRFSDPCLLALARARLPHFRKSDVELSGKVEQTSTDDRKLAAAIRKLAEQAADQMIDPARSMVEDAINGVPDEA